MYRSESQGWKISPHIWMTPQSSGLRSPVLMSQMANATVF